MHIKGFNLEILVNNEPLKERDILEEKLGPSTTGRSFIYTDSAKDPEFSTSSNFAMVPEIQEIPINYTIRISSDRASKRKPILARIYVDGFDDSTSFRLMNKNPVYKDGFKNSNRQLKHHFQFNKSTFVKHTHSLNNNKRSSQFGGLGAVSVYFYEARILADCIGICKREDFIDFDNDDLNILKVPETHQYQEIGVITSFGPGINYEQYKHLQKTIKPLTKFRSSPIAVLHLHYRPYEWFTDEKLLVDPNKSFKDKVSIDEQSIITKREKLDNVKDSFIVNAKDNKESVGVVKERDSQSLGNRKREDISVVKEKDSQLLGNRKRKFKGKGHDNEPIITKKKMTSKVKEKDFQSQSSITKKCKKCKYRKIIKIVDSDNDDNDDHNLNNRKCKFQEIIEIIDSEVDMIEIIDSDVDTI